LNVQAIQNCLIEMKFVNKMRTLSSELDFGIFRK
jgi:hypothetical protein